MSGIAEGWGCAGLVQYSVSGKYGGGRGSGVKGRERQRGR
jgi:hypothetical protein